MHRKASCRLLAVLLASAVFRGRRRRSVGDSRRGPYPAGRQLGRYVGGRVGCRRRGYSPSDDTSGFHGATSSNIAFNKVIGDDVPEARRRHGQSDGGLRQGGQKCADGCTWKSSGCCCLDGDGLLGRGTAQVRRGFRRPQEAPAGRQRQHHQVHRFRQDLDPLGQGELRPPDVPRHPFRDPLLHRVRADGGRRSTAPTATSTPFPTTASGTTATTWSSAASHDRRSAISGRPTGSITGAATGWRARRGRPTWRRRSRCWTPRASWA